MADSKDLSETSGGSTIFQSLFEGGLFSSLPLSHTFILLPLSSFQGCEVVVSGKLRGQRAKAMKFVDGLMIHSGNPAEEYVDTAVRHVLLRQVWDHRWSWVS